MPTLVTASHEAFISGFTAYSAGLRTGDAGSIRWSPDATRKDRTFRVRTALAVRTLFNMFEPLTGTSSAIIRTAAGGRIRLVTIAPEADGAVAFIKKAVADGITIAIGHTGATSDQVAAAADAGATTEHASRQRGARSNAAASQLHLGSARRFPADGQHHSGRASSSSVGDSSRSSPQKGNRTSLSRVTRPGLAGCPPGQIRSRFRASRNSRRRTHRHCRAESTAGWFEPRNRRLRSSRIECR